MAKVFLSAGHGGNDPGAVGNGLREKDINLNIMLACRDELVRHGVKVVCSRTRDENDPVQQEVREANASGADLALSIHTNAGGGDGSESFYYKGNNDGKRLAELCEKHTKAIGQNSRGVKTNNLMFTRETTMTAVLCECAFIDRSNDISIVDTTAEQKKFGVAYAKAILEYYGINYSNNINVSTNPIPSTPQSKPVSKPTSNKLSVDGWWGVNTTKRLQQIFGTTIDGIVSNQYRAYKATNPGLESGWEWKNNPIGSSELIRAIQKKVGVETDGYIGPVTIRAMQKWLGTVQDGKVSGPSQMVKALQTWANRQ